MAQGRTATFPCETKGNPQPAVFWQKEGSLVRANNLTKPEHSSLSLIISYTSKHIALLAGRFHHLLCLCYQHSALCLDSCDCMYNGFSAQDSLALHIDTLTHTFTQHFKLHYLSSVPLLQTHRYTFVLRSRQTTVCLAKC